MIQRTVSKKYKKFGFLDFFKIVAKSELPKKWAMQINWYSRHKNRDPLLGTTSDSLLAKHIIRRECIINTIGKCSEISLHLQSNNWKLHYCLFTCLICWKTDENWYKSESKKTCSIFIFLTQHLGACKWTTICTFIGKVVILHFSLKTLNVFKRWLQFRYNVSICWTSTLFYSTFVVVK